ncbi:MAG: Cof-type HAD-IIB family hydrolase [Brotaphodocola sp.]
MSKIKLIALDLDGTLLNSQKRLSERNENALKECIRRGIEIVPCTGRILQGIPDFIRDFPGVRYAITVNGAAIVDIQNKKEIDQRKFNTQQALEILEMAKEFNTMYDAYIEGQGYGEKRFMDHMEQYGIPPVVQKMVSDTRLIVPDVIEKVREERRPVEKINYFFGDMQERVRAREALLKRRDDVIISSSFPFNLEINAVGATKGEGILRLAAHLGIEPEATMGFGDGENDLSMMQKAGLGVAMANGEEIVKNAADYVTAHNDEDGVAQAIEKFVLSE